MYYLALGDSVSIDDFKETAASGAASQLARLIGASRFENLAQGGWTTNRVIDGLADVSGKPDLATLTIGGNDLLELGYAAGKTGPSSPDEAIRPVLANLTLLGARLAGFGCPVIMNTVYDPTDGDDALVREELDMPPDWRVAYDGVNAAIKRVATVHGFLLADLQTLFAGHGIASAEPWFVIKIDPNLAGATAIAREWHRLFVAKHII